MHIFALPMVLLMCDPTQDCRLTKSFETPFIKVKYTTNWNYFSVGEAHTLMYYEEDNFARREEAEITFTYSPTRDKNYLCDTSTLATRYVTAMAANLKDKLETKFSEISLQLDVKKESRVRMANTIWSKVVMAYSGTDEKGEAKDGNFTFYFQFLAEGITMIRVNHYRPFIKTVNTELPCIFNSIELKKVFSKKS